MVDLVGVTDHEKPAAFWREELEKRNPGIAPTIQSSLSSSSSWLRVWEDRNDAHEETEKRTLVGLSPLCYKIVQEKVQDELNGDGGAMIRLKPEKLPNFVRPLPIDALKVPKHRPSPSIPLFMPEADTFGPSEDPHLERSEAPVLGGREGARCQPAMALRPIQPSKDRRVDDNERYRSRKKFAANKVHSFAFVSFSPSITTASATAIKHNGSQQPQEHRVEPDTIRHQGRCTEDAKW